MDAYTAKIAQAKTMQLATVNNGRPWVCSVYFVLLGDNFYWLSEPHRRHSRELAADAQCAAAIVLKDSIPVVGVQLEGEAEIVTEARVVKTVLDLYIAKYGVGGHFFARFQAGTNKHNLHCLSPSVISVFDETAGTI